MISTPPTEVYLGSFLRRSRSGGLPLAEIRVSDSTSTGFHGYQIQPVAGSPTARSI